MASLFQYVKTEQVPGTYRHHNGDILRQRRIVIARLGDLTLFLEGTDKGPRLLVGDKDGNEIYDQRVFSDSEPPYEEMTLAVEELKESMSRLYHGEVNARRDRIWEWYVLGWNERHKAEEDKPEGNGKSDDAGCLSKEEFLDREYVNVSSTLRLIEKYAADDTEKEEYETFAAADIMELLQEKNRQKMNNAPAVETPAGHTRMYEFRVGIEAEDSEEAESKLRMWLMQINDPSVRLIM